MANKIGIVSLFKGENFGNKLQNYAVESMIKKYGFQPETFRYEIIEKSPIPLSLKDKIKPSYIISYVKIKYKAFLKLKNSDVSGLRKLMWRFCRNKRMQSAMKDRKKAYADFDQAYLHFAERKICLEESDEVWTDEYHRFVCGSDQVWNPYYPSTNSICFLQFSPIEKRVAIAPSFGVSAIPLERETDFKRWIEEIPYLSVREDAGKNIIEKLTGRKAVVLTDPTMYLTKEDWMNFAKKPNIDMPNKFVLTYFLGDRTKEYGKTVEQFAKTNSCKIVHLFDLMQPQYYTFGPQEFVWCIMHAEKVFTDSFHACVFSIIFHKSFLAFDRKEDGKSMGSRITTLLTTFEMQYRKYHKDYESVDANIEGTEIDCKLEELRGAAQRFLTNALERE